MWPEERRGSCLFSTKTESHKRKRYGRRHGKEGFYIFTSEGVIRSRKSLSGKNYSRMDSRVFVRQRFENRGKVVKDLINIDRLYDT